MKRTHDSPRRCAIDPAQSSLDFEIGPAGSRAELAACIDATALAYGVIPERPVFSASQPSSGNAAPSSSDDAQLGIEAIRLWIDARCPKDFSKTSDGSLHTRRQYEREAERFLLWLRQERGRSLTETNLSDCIAYRSFLADPQPQERWCAPRGTPRSSSRWRPFEGKLSAASSRQAMTVLRGLFEFLKNQGLLRANPWAAVAKPRANQADFDTTRSLSRAQWQAVQHVMTEMAKEAADQENPRLRQMVWMIGLLHSTGLRLTELVSASVSDLRWFEFDETVPGDNDELAIRVGGWCLSVVGKGGARRRVPVPSELVAELHELLVIGAPGAALSVDGAGALRSLLVRWRRNSGGRWQAGEQLREQGVYLQVRRFMLVVAAALRRAHRPEDALALESVSTHWLRHTHASHAVAAGVPLDVVRCNLGHASLNTTTLYTRAELERRVRATQSIFFASQRQT